MALLVSGVLCGASVVQAADEKTTEPAKKATPPACGEKAAPAACDANVVKKKQEEAVEKALKAYEEEKREQQERLRKDRLWKPSHEQVSVIKVNEGTMGRIVHSFCLNKEGRLLVCCGRNPAEATAKKDTDRGEIVLFSPEGKKVGVWQTAIEPQAICIASDGTVYIGGAGKLCTLNKDGNVLRTSDAPNVAELPQLPAAPGKKPELKGEAAEAAKKATQKEIAELQKKSLEIREKLEKIVEEARAKGKLDDERTRAALETQFKAPLEQFQAIQGKLMGLQTSPEARVMQLRMEREQQLTITGMAVTDRDVFVVCRSVKGYGFTVWRTDRNLGNPKKVIENLAGCCGQMDIQANSGELWVAHNARHKVERYDRDGKKVASFGKTDRINADGFGGCCEPKNLRFASNGDLFAAESGPPTCVKCFTKDGKFLGVAVVAPWQSGCVRVTTELSDQGKFFVLNSGENTIHVFAKKAATPASADNKTAKQVVK
jgi:hypothetical protein